jgi:hypothetical protein
MEVLDEVVRNSEFVLPKGSTESLLPLPPTARIAL